VADITWAELFGLGFDTASEVALLVVGGTSAAAGIRWYAISWAASRCSRVLATQLRWTGAVWDWVGDVDLNVVGFVFEASSL
jgi:high-affinity nickel permease